MELRQTSPPDRMLSIRDVQKLTSLARATTYRAIADGRHPRPIKLTPGGARVGFREADIIKWLQDPLGWNEDQGDRNEIS